MAAIDVLMPMRDAEPWVVDAWQSLERQRFRDWRLIAVDDGSLDRTAACLRAAARSDRRLVLLEAPRLGIEAALNRGLRAVCAPVVARMDADDLAHPSRLETLWGLLQSDPGLSVAASRVSLFPRAAVSPSMGRYLRWQNGLLTHRQIRAERYVECTVTHASAAFRTRALVQVGGWREGGWPEDLDLFLRLHGAEARFEKSPKLLYFWRERPNRETRTSPRMTPEAFRQTKACHLAAELKFRGIARVSVLGRGDSLRTWAQALAEAALAVEAVEHRPGSSPPTLPGFAICCFGSEKARQRVRSDLAGLREDEQYLFVA